MVFEYENVQYFDLTLGSTIGRNLRSLAFALHSAFACPVKKVARATAVTSVTKTTTVMTIAITNGQQAPPPVVPAAAGAGLVAAGVGAAVYSRMGGGAGALPTGYPIGASSTRRVTETRRSTAPGPQ